MKQPFLIVTITSNETKSKTIELQREIYDKLNVKKYPKFNFGASMPSAEFLNFLWIMNGCTPKNIPPQMVAQVKENVKNKIDAEVILFINSNSIPLNSEALDFMYDNAKEGKIVTFSLFDGIALSKDVYESLETPNMHDLFATAKKNKIPILTLSLSKVDKNATKTYSYENKELFWQTGGENQEQNYWNKCEEVLVRGMYEDRSIKH